MQGSKNIISISILQSGVSIEYLMVCQAYRGAEGREGWSPTVATLTSGVTSAALRTGKCAVDL